MKKSTIPSSPADKTRLTTWQILKRLGREHIKPQKKRILVAVGCMLLVAAATAANAWIMQPVLDKVFIQQDEKMLLIIPAVVFVLALIKGVATYGQSLIMKYVGQRIVTDIQLKLYSHLLNSDMRVFNENSSGKLLSRFANDVMMIRRSVSTLLTNSAKEFVTLIFLIGVMLYQSVTLSLIALGVFPLAIYPLMRLAKRMRGIAEKTQEELGNYTARLDDTFQAIRIVKAYGREEDEANRARNVIEGIFRLYYKASKIDAASPPIMEVISGMAIAAVIGYGGHQVLQGVTTPGAFFSFITALIMVYKPLRSMSGFNSSLQEGLASAERIFSVLDLKAEIHDAPNAVILPAAPSEIIFENVSFNYNTEKSALNNLSFTVPAGKRVALVGESGSGKSTVFQLLLRFYDPGSGTIRINGHDIKSLTLSSLRERIAFVNQEATLFDDTVRANILYGNPKASDEEIFAAAYNAAANDFISELPEGYDTLVGQHGLRLSGGQRQGIAIARAMLRDSPILLLDEATSALDPLSEHQVQQALDRLMKGRTTIVIAHRLATVINSDLIFVLSQGKVIESGTHQQLLDKGGEYKKLYDRQFLNT